MFDWFQGEQHHDLLHRAAAQQAEAFPLQHPQRQEQPHDCRSAGEVIVYIVYTQ